MCMRKFFWGAGGGEDALCMKSDAAFIKQSIKTLPKSRVHILLPTCRSVWRWRGPGKGGEEFQSKIREDFAVYVQHSTAPQG